MSLFDIPSLLLLMEFDQLIYLVVFQWGTIAYFIGCEREGRGHGW